MVTRFVVSVLACALVCSEAAAFTDAEFCAHAEEIARRINANSPAEIYEGVTLAGATVVCANKLFQFRKRADSVLPLGWRRERTKVLSRAVCKDLFLEAIRNGWMITEVVSFSDGQEVETYASCD